MEFPQINRTNKIYIWTELDFKDSLKSLISWTPAVVGPESLKSVRPAGWSFG